MASPHRTILCITSYEKGRPSCVKPGDVGIEAALGSFVAGLQEDRSDGLSHIGYHLWS